MMTAGAVQQQGQCRQQQGLQVALRRPSERHGRADLTGLFQYEPELQHPSSHKQHSGMQKAHADTLTIPGVFKPCLTYHCHPDEPHYTCYTTAELLSVLNTTTTASD